MKCIKCGEKVKLLKTHLFPDKQGYTRTMRRYLCENCQIKWTTNEVVDIKSIELAKPTFKDCHTLKEYDYQDCSKCPYLKECGGY